jgi:hypothetical protein
MTITRLPARTCPTCGKTLDAVGDLPGAEDPRPPCAGDYTICAYCATILTFSSPTTLRTLTPAELEAVPADDELFTAQRYFLLHRFQRGH